jgi:hypothetical protein
MRGCLFVSIVMLVMAGSLTGCASFMATSEEYSYHEDRLAPRQSASSIAVYEGDRPSRPHVVLGRVVATQGLFGSRASVMAELRRKAATIGADALVDLSDSRAPGGRSGVGASEQTRYAQSGTISTSESWVQNPHAAIRLSISGLAIRFEDP